MKRISNWWHRYFYPVKYIHINRYGQLEKAPPNTQIIFSHIRVRLETYDDEIELYVYRVYDVFCNKEHFNVALHSTDVILTF